jgi:hypothetical protein
VRRFSSHNPGSGSEDCRGTHNTQSSEEEGEEEEWIHSYAVIQSSASKSRADSAEFRESWKVGHVLRLRTLERCCIWKPPCLPSFSHFLIVNKLLCLSATDRPRGQHHNKGDDTGWWRPVCA